MSHLLQEAFDVVAPHLGEALVPPSHRDELRAGLGTLAPILQLGLEVRLGEGEEQVDVQQAILRNQGHPHRLAAHVRGLFDEQDEASTVDPAWHRIDAVLRAWADGTDFGWMREWWLEYDVPDGISEAMLPSIFVERPPSVPVSEVQRVVEALQGRALPNALRETLHATVAAMPQGGYVSHIGLMLARPVDALRVNVKGLGPESAAVLVGALGGETEEVTRRFTGLAEHAAHLTLALDLANRVLPGLGLEVFFHRQPDADDGWERLLDHLVETGSCTAAKREAILAWSGISVPPQTEAPWPEALLVRALAEPGRLSAIGRRLHHLKVTYRPGQPPVAKAYLGIGHVWLGPLPREAPAR